MKTSHVHAVLAAFMTTCMTRTGLAFVPPQAGLALGAPLTAAASTGQGALGARVPAARLAFRLAAAREDCKSCMEAELLEEERKRAGAEGEDGQKRVAARRAALQEVNRRIFFPALRPVGSLSFSPRWRHHTPSVTMRRWY